MSIPINIYNADMPFSISLIKRVIVESEPTIYNFIVNIGDINSLIFQTYKFNSNAFDSRDIASNDFFRIYEEEDKIIPAVKNAFSAQVESPLGEESTTFRLGQEWKKTFSTTSTCSVYLTIPKIPIGYNFFSDIQRGKNIWWFSSKNDFINATHIDVSTSEGFDDRLIQNKLYIEKRDDYQRDRLIFGLSKDRPQRLEPKSSYPGKIYVKLADITIDNEGSLSVKHFLRSNIISPFRYIKLGCSNFNSLKVFVSFVADRKITGGGEYIKYQLDTYNPEIFLKSLTYIKESAETIFQEFYSKMYSSFAPDFLYEMPSLDPSSSESSEEKDKKIVNLKVFRVILFYKEHAGEKFVFENVFENMQILNDFKKFYFELDNLESDQPFVQKKPFSESDCLDFLNLDDDQDLVELINFTKT